MARKPFKIVNNLDLSGNKLIDVSEIYRGDYDLTGVNNHLTIKAGSDPAGAPDTEGGDLLLYSGSGVLANGAIRLRIAESAYGIDITPATAILLATDNQAVTIATGTAATKLTSTVEATAASTGALQVAGGAYIAKDLIVNGGDIFTTTAASFNIFNTAVTNGTVSVAGYATTINIAHSTTAAKTINIATNSTGASTVVIGNDAVGSSTKLLGRTITLGETATTTVSVGGAVSGNTFKLRSTDTGTINYTSDVAGGIVNFISSLTGTGNFVTSASAVNIASGVVSTIQLGGTSSTVKVGAAGATLHVGALTGTIDTAVTPSTAYVFNSNATTVYAFGTATEVHLGNAASALELKGTTLTAPNLHTLSLNGANAGVLTLQGTTATTLTLFNTTQSTVNAFNAATAVTVGATSGTFTIRNSTVTLSHATTFSAPLAKTVAIGTTTDGAVTTNIGTAAYNTEVNLVGQAITLGSSSVGALNLFNSNVTTVNAFAAATTIDIGNAGSAAVVNFNTTKDATSSTVGGVVVDGGVAIAKKLYVGTNTTLGNDSAAITTVRGKLQLPDSNTSYRLILGGSTHPVELFRSGDNILTIDDNVTINGVGGTTTLLGANTVNAFTGSATALNLAVTGSMTTVKGNFTVDGTTTLTGELDHVLFKPYGTYRAHSTGELYYYTVDDALIFTPSITGVYQTIGQELYARVKNETANLIANGTVVYRVNGTEDYISVAPARANAVATSSVLGIVTHDLAAGAVGLCTVRGVVRGINTSALTAGKVYLSASVAGALVSTAPTGSNYAVELGEVQTVGVSGSVYVMVQQSWTTTATFNALRAVSLEAHDSFQLPTVTTTSLVEGSVRFSTTANDKFIKVYDGSVWRSIVDADSTQALSNKTYEGLTLTKQTNGFTIVGGTTARALTVASNLTVSTGAVEIAGAAGNLSKLVLPNATLTINTSAAAGYATYYSAAGTLSGEQHLAVTRGGTGLGSLDANYFYKGNGTADLVKSNLYDDGTIKVTGGVDVHMLSGDGRFVQDHSSTAATASMDITHGGAKTATNAAVRIAHTATSSTTSALKRALTVESSGAWTGTSSSVTAVYADAAGGTTNYSFYGNRGVLRNIDKIQTDGELAANGGSLTSTATTFNLLTSTVTTLNMLAAAGSTLTIGTDDATDTRLTRLFANMQIGSASNTRVVNHYGQFNFGGPSGFTALYNAADDSLDFIKL